MDVHSVKLSPRTQTGKKVNVLRRQGLVPVHVYGAKIEPASLQVEDQILVRLLARVGTNVPISVEYDGSDQENICFVREVQRHPVTETIIHVDFLRVDISQKISAEVPVILDLIADIKKHQNKIILLVEHKMDVVRSLSDRIVVLHNGELVADGEPAQVIASPVVQQVYLGASPDQPAAAGSAAS